MKQGLIVYLVDSAAAPENFNVVGASQSLGYQADQVELVSQHDGFFSVEDAWHFLLSRGCGRIKLLVAQAEGSEHMRALGPPVRLYG